MRHILYLEIVGIVAVDQEDVGHARHVAQLEYVGRVRHFHAVYNESVAIKFGSKRGGSGKFPDTVVLYKVCHPGSIKIAIGGLDFLSGQEIPCHLYLHCIGGFESERDCLVGVDFRGDYGSASP